MIFYPTVFWWTNSNGDRWIMTSIWLGNLIGWFGNLEDGPFLFFSFSVLEIREERTDMYTQNNYRDQITLLSSSLPSIFRCTSQCSMRCLQLFKIFSIQDTKCILRDNLFILNNKNKINMSCKSQQWNNQRSDPIFCTL